MYMSFDEIIEKSPSEYYDVEVEKRTEKKIKWDGGNDYELNPIDKSFNKNYLRKWVVAYSDGTDLYINCFIYKLQQWYAKVLSDNKYFVFSAALPLIPKKFGMKNNSNILNLFGGIGRGINGMKLALVRLPYIMDKSNEQLTLVTEKNIAVIIGNNKDLLEKFNMESEKNSMETILEYLIKWNENE